MLRLTTLLFDESFGILTAVSIYFQTYILGLLAVIPVLSLIPPSACSTSALDTSRSIFLPLEKSEERTLPISSSQIELTPKRFADAV